VNEFQKNESPKSESQDTESPKRGFLVQIAKYSQLAFVLPAATVAGWLLGAGLDHWLHTTWLYIAGLLLGIVAGFVDLIRTVTKDSK
jgi:F0F1-type ATP synthase assembly protein I